MPALKAFHVTIACVCIAQQSGPRTEWPPAPHPAQMSFAQVAGKPKGRKLQEVEACLPVLKACHITCI